MSKELLNNATFAQLEAIDHKTATGVISINLPSGLVELGQSIKLSDNGKVLPNYEAKISFEVTLDDGTVTTISGSLAMWFAKEHTKAAVSAAKKAKEDAEKAAHEAEVQKQKEALLSNFTPEQIQALAALGMVK